MGGWRIGASCVRDDAYAAGAPVASGGGEEGEHFDALASVSGVRLVEPSSPRSDAVGATNTVHPDPDDAADDEAPVPRWACFSGDRGLAQALLSDREPELVHVPPLVDAATTWLQSLRRFLAYCGPGILVSISYIDPGNLEADLQAGTAYGRSLLWVLLWATGIGLVVQSQAICLGAATGASLSRAMREEYPMAWRFPLWVVTELTMVVVDIPEVVGTAIALQIFGGLPLVYGVLVAGGSTMLCLMVQLVGIRQLEAFIALMLALVVGCYTAQNVFLSPYLSTVDTLRGLAVPRIADTGALFIAISLLGSIVQPHNLYLHSALVLTRKKGPGARETRAAMRWGTVDLSLALVVSLFINVSVICVADFVGNAPVSADVAEALAVSPLRTTPGILAQYLGPVASLLFTVALLSSGQSSTMTGTLAGQYVIEGFFKVPFSPLLRGLLTRAAAITPAVVVAAVYGNDGAETLVQIASVLTSFFLPFALIPLLKFTTSRRVMGDFAPGRPLTIFLWAVAAAVVGANTALGVLQLQAARTIDATPAGIAQGVAAGVGSAAYFAALLALLVRPVSWDGTVPDSAVVAVGLESVSPLELRVMAGDALAPPRAVRVEVPA